MLNWTLAELVKFQNQPLAVDTTVDLTADLKARLSDILDAEPFHVKATLRFEDELWVLDAHMTGSLTVPSTRSLEPVVLPIDERFNELYAVDENHLPELDNNEIIMTFDDGHFDLLNAIEDNIILSIPTQVLTPAEAKNETMPKGQDWTVISENDYFQQKQADEGAPNPEFAKLKGLFENEKTDENDKDD